MGVLELAPVGGYHDLYSHLDSPSPGVTRLTYVRLSVNHRTVMSFASCLMNGEVEGHPCVAVGYAVPEQLRNKGAAKQILSDVIQDQRLQAGKNGIPAVYIEAVIDISNLPSQKVAEAVLGGERERITDTASGRPAIRYTARLSTDSSH